MFNFPEISWIHCETVTFTRNRGGESDRGGLGGTMGRTTVISIVNTNGVVLCEYLPQ